MTGMQGSIWVLKDHLDLLVELPGPMTAKPFTGNVHFPGPCGNQTGQRPKNSRFPRPALPNKAKTLSLYDLKIGVFHGVDAFFRAIKPDIQILYDDTAHLTPLTLSARAHSGSRVSTASRSCGVSSRGNDFRRPRV